MESFFSLLQKNVLNRHPWATRDKLHTEIVYWIEHAYHRRRRQRALGKLTPIEYELAFDPDEDPRRMIHAQPPSTEPAAAPC